MTKFTLFSTLFAISYLLGSCTPVLFKVMGLKQGKSLARNEIQRAAKKYKIQADELFEIDTSYFTFVYRFDSLYPVEVKNHLQPLQALYYDSTGNLISYQVNCSVGGFPNLKWNQQGAFNQFPPRTQARLDTLFDLETQLSFLEPTIPATYFDADYLVIVHWSRFMGRQSKRLIKQVRENSRLYHSGNVKLLFVNTDNLWATVDFD